MMNDNEGTWVGTEFVAPFDPWAFIVGISVGIAIVLLFASCEAVPTQPRHKARVTFYHPREIDKYHGKRVCWGRKTSSGARATQGVTIAAPKWVPFGTVIRIPELQPVLGTDTFVVQDRGGGVSRFGPEWLDVFVNNVSTMQWLQRDMPEWLTYQIL